MPDCCRRTNEENRRSTVTRLLLLQRRSTCPIAEKEKEDPSEETLYSIRLVRRSCYFPSSSSLLLAHSQLYLASSTNLVQTCPHQALSHLGRLPHPLPHPQLQLLGQTTAGLLQAQTSTSHNERPPQHLSGLLQILLFISSLDVSLFSTSFDQQYDKQETIWLEPALKQPELRINSLTGLNTDQIMIIVL